MTNIYILFFVFNMLFNMLAFTGIKAYTLYVSSLVILYALILFFAVIIDLKTLFKDLCYLAVLGIYCLFSTFVTGGGIGSVLSNMLPLVLLCCLELCEVDQKFKFIICACAVLMVVVFATMSVIMTEYNHWLIGEINPNTVGIFTVSLFALWCAFTKFIGWKEKLLFVLFLLLSIITIINVMARTSLIGMCVYLVLLVIPSRYFKPKFTFAVHIFVVLVALLLPLVYLYMYRNGVQLTLFGKNLFTGREGVWEKMFAFMDEKGAMGWLYGIGSHMAIHGEKFNSHNSYYSITACFGVFGLIGFVLFYVLKLKNVIKYSRDKEIKNLFIIFITMCFMSGFETLFNVFSTTFVIFLPLGMAMCRARKLEKESRLSAKLDMLQ